MKQIFKTKKVFFLTVLLILAILGTTSTFALLTSATEPITNRFVAGDVNTHMKESFEGTVKPGAIVKKTPAIVNDGPSNALIRVRITVSPECDVTFLYGSWEENGTFTKSGEVLTQSSESNSHHWSYHAADGFYYYHVVTAPHSAYECSETLFDAVEIGKDVTGNFDITIYQEAVFAEGYPAGTEVSTEVLTAAFEAVNH